MSYGLTVKGTVQGKELCPTLLLDLVAIARRAFKLISSSVANLYINYKVKQQAVDPKERGTELVIQLPRTEEQESRLKSLKTDDSESQSRTSNLKR